jgi:hypothetical protein
MDMWCGCDRLRKEYRSLGEETVYKMVGRMSDLKMKEYHQDETYGNGTQVKNGSG